MKTRAKGTKSLRRKVLNILSLNNLQTLMEKMKCKRKECRTNECKSSQR